MAPKINDPLALIQYLQNGSGGKSPSPSSQLNYQQDLLSTLFNPQFAAANDMYDPLSLTSTPFQFATPVLTGALNSATPIWQEVAQAIMSGTIDRQNAISAVAEALGVDEYSTGAGLTIAGSFDTFPQLLEALPFGPTMPGQGYLVQGTLYVWNASEVWANVGVIQGPTGECYREGCQDRRTIEQRRGHGDSREEADQGRIRADVPDESPRSLRADPRAAA